jgi:flagellar hook-associated protein 2
VSSSTITPITMNLTGQYATDFQTILDKAVQTAEVPLTQLQTQDTAVLSQETALGSLQTTVAALTGSLTALGTDGSSGTLTATSSDSSSVTATDAGATAPATYTINSVTYVASAASETSLNSYTDASTTPITSGTVNAGAMQLVVGTHTYNFTLSSANNNLSGLESQINGLGAGVTASILTAPGGNYLSIQANATGATTLQLNDMSNLPANSTTGGTNIITNTDQGTDAKFQLNGITITQASNTVNNVISGLTFNIVAPTSSPVTLTLASDPTQLTNDLQTFVTNYNSLVTAVQAQVGGSNGALIGDSTIDQLQQAMQHLSAYFSSTTGSVQSLSDLGVTFNSTTGQATFDPSVIAGMSSSQLTDALDYVGSATTGLGAFSGTFDQFSDPVTGLIQTEIASDKKSDSSLQSQIDTTTDKINTMQQNLATQIEQADALESEYESQQTELTASLQGLDLVLYGKAAGSPGS